MKQRSLVFLVIAATLLAAACGKSDADLQKAVSAKLASDNVSGVSVAVNGGVAMLSGEVADITVKTKAEASAKSVDGIKSVDASRITTKPLPTPVPAPADPMLQGKVDEMLKKAGCTGAIAKVEAGTVTLTGTVPEAKFAECIKVVNESGAGKLNNQLQKGK